MTRAFKKPLVIALNLTNPRMSRGELLKFEYLKNDYKNRYTVTMVAHAGIKDG